MNTNVNYVVNSPHFCSTWKSGSCVATEFVSYYNAGLYLVLHVLANTPSLQCSYGMSQPTSDGQQWPGRPLHVCQTVSLRKQGCYKAKIGAKGKDY